MPSHHERNQQIKRQWRILLALSDREWFTLREILDSIPQAHRHKRTIMRDLEMLREVFPIERRIDDHHTFQYRLKWPLARILSRGPR